MPTEHMTPAPKWKKSTRSGGNSGQCVQAAFNIVPHVLVGDSKVPDGPALAVAPGDWVTFTAAAKAGRFARS